MGWIQRWPASTVLVAACYSSAWPTTTLGRTGWWAACHAGRSARGARARGDGTTWGIACARWRGGISSHRRRWTATIGTRRWPLLWRWRRDEGSPAGEKNQSGDFSLDDGGLGWTSARLQQGWAWSRATSARHRLTRTDGLGSKMLKRRSARDGRSRSVRALPRVDDPAWRGREQGRAWGRVAQEEVRPQRGIEVVCVPLPPGLATRTGCRGWQWRSGACLGGHEELQWCRPEGIASATHKSRRSSGSSCHREKVGVALDREKGNVVWTRRCRGGVFYSRWQGDGGCRPIQPIGVRPGRHCS
jgi:hypothetical protein